MSFWQRARSYLLAHRRTIGAVAAIALVGIGVRLWVAHRSEGTNDIVFWRGFASNIQDHGIRWTYENVRIFNHPPLPAYFALLVLKVEQAFGLRFSFVFKLLPLAADVLGAALLYWIWQPKGRGLLAAAFFAVAPASVLVTAHHGNTDSVMAALSLLAAFCFDRGRFLLAGLALGAAINVKLIPVLLIPVLLVQCRRWRDVGRFVGGLAVWVIPFIPVLAIARAAFVRNAVAYNSNSHRWGLNALLEFGTATVRIREYTAEVWPLFRENGRYLILAAVAAIAAVGRWRGLPARALLALTFAAFLILTPGFGVQYLVYAVPALLAVSLARGFVWSWVAGLFLLLLYLEFWNHQAPWYTRFVGPFHPAAALVGIACWALLIEAAVAILLERRRKT